MLDQRGQLLRAALGFAGLPRPSYDRSLHALRTWLMSLANLVNAKMADFTRAAPVNQFREIH